MDKLKRHLCRHNMQVAQTFLDENVNTLGKRLCTINTHLFWTVAARSADKTNTCAVLLTAPAHYVLKLPLDVSRCCRTRRPSGPHLKLGRDLKAEH